VLEHIATTTITTAAASSSSGIRGSCTGVTDTSNKGILIQCPPLRRIVATPIHGLNRFPLIPDRFVSVIAGRIAVLVITLVAATKDGVLRHGGFAVAGAEISKSTCHQRTHRQKK